MQISNSYATAPSILTKNADGPSTDAFSRERISSPIGIFDAQFTYGLAPLLFEPITSGAGSTITHDTTNRMALMTFATALNGFSSYMQSYDHFRYQPGRGGLAFITFNFKGAASNCTKFAGYSDGTNGIEFRNNGTVNQVALLSATTNGNQVINQINWNVDKMDGNGPSGVVLDVSKIQILVIDFQALYAGRVRVGFDIDGQIYYVHQFLHSNLVLTPYIQSANLPIRCGMVATGSVSTTMNFLCSTVISEGGQDEVAGYSFVAEGTVTAASGSRTHVLSVRPKTTFNSITNRSRFILEQIDILVTGNNPILWELCLGQAITGTTTFNDANTTYSAAEFNTAGTISGSPTIVMENGYVASNNATKASTQIKINPKYPITLDAAGLSRLMGTVSVLVTGVGGTSAVRVSLGWREIR